MREVFAFLRRDALVAVSYRTGMVFSLMSLVSLVVPLYFIAGALQPLIGPTIESEGGEYFAFVIAGMATYQFVTAAVLAIPSALASGLRTGTFEALLATPLRSSRLLAGFLAYPFVWTVARASVLLAAGALLGAQFQAGRFLLAVLIWAAITMAYVPFGILGCAMLLIVRTTGPLPTIVLMGSMFLGGVYYPTTIIPSWLRHLSDVVPLTYGLRALRRTLAADLPLAQIGSDIAILMAMAVALLLVSTMIFGWALQHARRAGSLAQY